MSKSKCPNLVSEEELLDDGVGRHNRNLSPSVQPEYHEDIELAKSPISKSKTDE